MTMKYEEMRRLALGAARSYLRRQGIDPATIDADGALAALDDICRLDQSLVVYVWYKQLDSENQVRLFRREWKRWRR